MTSELTLQQMQLPERLSDYARRVTTTIAMAEIAKQTNTEIIYFYPEKPHPLKIT